MLDPKRPITEESHNGNIYLLKSRGDGIQAWHIPIILNVMAKMERQTTRSGFVNPDTIWGLEEPENNLELSNAFKLARQICGFSTDIQVLITSHSPAFYELRDDPNYNAETYCLVKDDQRITRLADHDTAQINNDMGILDLITRYVSEANERAKEQEELVNELRGKAITARVLVLCEDENIGLLETVLKSSGLTDDHCQVLSYSGCGNIHGAFQLARLIKNIKSPETKVVVHRDQDYLNAEEIEELRRKAKNADSVLFVTLGNEIESHFLNPDYIAATTGVDAADVAELLDQATEAVVEKSYDALSKSLKKPDGTWGYKKMIETYENDPERYRDSKAVLGQLRQLLHEHHGVTLNTNVAHESLRVDILADLVA